MRGITADWLIPGEAWNDPLRKGAVVLDADGRTIVAIGDADSLRSTYASARWEQHSGVLLPGLINAHIVLEDAGLRARGGAGHLEFALSVARARLERGDEFDLAVFDEGCARLRDTGTVAVGVESTSLLECGALKRANIHSRVFHPIRGMRADVAEVMRTMGRELRAERGAGLRITESVQSIYAVHPDTVRDVATLARETGERTLVPLNESPATRSWLERGEGPIAAVLSGSSASPSDWSVPGCSPMMHAQKLGAMGKHTLLTNMLDTQTLEVQDIHDLEAPVVLTPRQNLYTEARLPQCISLMRERVEVSAGTGSAATTPDLDILAECALLFVRFGVFSPRTYLAMALGTAARALQFDSHLGVIEAGRTPGILHIACDTAIAERPEEFVLQQRQARRTFLADASL